MSDSLSNNIVTPNQISGMLSVLLINKILKYDFFAGSTNSFIVKMIYNCCLIVFLETVFYNLKQEYLGKIHFENIYVIYLCYWIALSITNNLYKINDQHEKIINAFKEIVLNIIIFAGLVTIYNIVAN